MGICYGKDGPQDNVRNPSRDVIDPQQFDVKPPEASAPPAPDDGAIFPGDEDMAINEAKMDSAEPTPYVETVQPEMEPDDESPSVLPAEELHSNTQEASQKIIDDSPAHTDEKKKMLAGEQVSAQAFYQGPVFSSSSNSLRCCEGGGLSDDGFEISNRNSYQSAAAFTVEKVVSFTVEVTETREYQTEGMILGFTKIDLEEAIAKVSKDDCEAHDLAETWCVTERSIKMPTQLKLIDWQTRAATKGDFVTLSNSNGDFRIDLNGKNVYDLPNVLPREPMTAVIQPRGVHARVRVC